jgi:hypothetical protein
VGGQTRQPDGSRRRPTGPYSEVKDLEITVEGKKLTQAEAEAFVAAHRPKGPDPLGVSEMNAIMRRVELKLPPLSNETPQERAFRIEVTKEIAKIHASGGSVEYVAE